MAIAVDTTVENQTNAAANTYTLGSVVVNNANSVLVVFYDNLQGTGDTVTLPAFNGTSMSVATKTNFTGPNTFIYAFYLINPVTGTHSFTCHTGGATDVGSCRAFVLTGVDQTNPIDNTGTATNASGSTGSLSITPTFSNGAMLSEAFVNASGVLSAGTNVNTLYAGYFTGQKQGSSVGATITGGSAFTQTYGVAPNDIVNIIGVILKIAGTTTVNARFFNFALR